MASSTNDEQLPKDYVPLPGSERRPSKDAKLLEPAEEFAGKYGAHPDDIN